MNIIKYRYYITYSYVSTTATIEVFPLGVDKLSIKYTGEEGQIFKRRELNGNLVFIDQPLIPSLDYSLFKLIDSSIDDKCTEIKFEIKRSCDNGLTYEDDFWNGYFSTTDGEFNLDKCIFTVDCKPDDLYRCFVEGIDTEVSLSTVPQSDNGIASIITTYEFFYCDGSEIFCDTLRPEPSPEDTWLVFHEDVCEGNQIYIYYREITTVACQDNVAIPPSGDDWIIDTRYDNCANGLSRWVRIPQTVVVNNPNPDVVAGNCDDGDTPPPKKVFLGVVKSNSTPTPLIVGQDIAFHVGSCNSGCHYFYRVKFPKANATYLWSVTGSGNSIVAGSTSTEVEVCFENNGNVRVTETTSCGSTQGTLAIQMLNVGDTKYNSETAIIGNQYLCPGETAIYCLNAFINTVPFIKIGATSVGTRITDLGDGCFEIIAGEEGELEVTFAEATILDPCTPYLASNVPSIVITVLQKKTIEPIYGAASVCKTSQAYYSIPETDLGGYVWEVTGGGTILSGQGTNEILVEWDGIAGIGFVYVSQDFNCNCNWIQIRECSPGLCSWWWCPDSDTTYSISSNTTLENIINTIKDRICPGRLDVKSDFFDWDAPGDTTVLYGYSPGINYVTGQSNHLTYLSLIPLRAMIFSFTGNVDYANPGIDEFITWENIQEIMREVFNAYWFIDNNGNLRIEHYSWFNRTVAYDLTDAYYHKYSVGKNIYSYDKTKAPKFERFKFHQSVNTDFVGAEISYAGTCINTNPKENVKNRGVSYLDTDIINLQNIGTEMGRDGFALLDFNSSFVLQSEVGLISGLLLTNAHLSWANLHYNYHRYNRVLLNGMMNLQQTIFLSALRFKKQVPVRFPFCCTDEINPLEDLITTLVGNGVVDEAEHDLKADTLTVTLLHDF